MRFQVLLLSAAMIAPVLVQAPASADGLMRFAQVRQAPTMSFQASPRGGRPSGPGSIAAPGRIAEGKVCCSGGNCVPVPSDITSCDIDEIAQTCTGANNTNCTNHGGSDFPD